jgi:hypothetical protein
MSLFGACIWAEQMGQYLKLLHVPWRTLHISLYGDQAQLTTISIKNIPKDKRFNEGTSSNFLDTSSRIKQEEKPLIDKGNLSSILKHLIYSLFLWLH